MKYLAVCLLFSVCYAAVPINDDTCYAGQKKCSLDCSSIILCPSKDRPLKTNCAQQSANKYPYCDPDTVTCGATNNCHPYQETNCYQLPEGWYPELLDCTLYYYCDKNHVKKNYACGDTEKYNPVSGFCEATAQCRSFSGSDLCKAKDHQLVAHPEAKNFYIYCGSPPELFTCRGGLSNFYEYDFNVETTNCDFKCLAAGRYPDQDKDMSWYWQCEKGADGQLKPTEHQCPKGFYFQADPTGGNGKCVANLRNL